VSKLEITSELGFPRLEHYNSAPIEITARQTTRRVRALHTAHSPDPDEISKDQFEQLLSWLDPDRDQAGTRYEWIRKRLIKIFICRGSTIPEELADRTVNRVARKLPEIRADYTGDPANYFAGVASNIFRESLKKAKLPTVGMPEPAPPDENEERLRDCFEKCVSSLTDADRELVLAYYQHEKQAKIDHRKDLAARLGLGMNALRIRACRIRADLQECVERCAARAASPVK
jgi:DNA-directed RNA polymerase specialized sigma24 family protein